MDDACERGIVSEIQRVWIEKESMGIKEDEIDESDYATFWSFAVKRGTESWNFWNDRGGVKMKKMKPQEGWCIRGIKEDYMGFCETWRNGNQELIEHWMGVWRKEGWINREEQEKAIHSGFTIACRKRNWKLVDWVLKRDYEIIKKIPNATWGWAIQGLCESQEGSQDWEVRFLSNRNKDLKDLVRKESIEVGLEKVIYRGYWDCVVRWVDQGYVDDEMLERVDQKIRETGVRWEEWSQVKEAITANKAWTSMMGGESNELKRDGVKRV